MSKALPSSVHRLRKILSSSAQSKSVLQSKSEAFSAISLIQPDELKLLDEQFNKSPILFSRLLYALSTAQSEESEIVVAPLIQFYDSFSEEESERAFYEWFNQTCINLIDHGEKAGREANFKIEIILQLKSDKLRSVVMRVLYDSDTNWSLWDQREFSNLSPRGCALFLASQGLNVNLSTKQYSKWTPCPLFHYHPERYKKSRNYLKHTDTNKLISDQRDWEQYTQEVAEAYNTQLAKEPLSKIVQGPNLGTLPIVRETETLILYSGFRSSGSHIFDISGHLSNMLQQSDCTDIPVSELASPYKHYYIHFGPQADLSLEEGWAVDGVYVQHLPEANLIQFLFTSLPSDPTWNQQWVTHMEPIATLAIAHDLYSDTLGTAIEGVINAKRLELSEKIAKGDQDWSSFARSQGFHGQVVENASTVGNNQLELFERRLPVLKQCLNLTANAMCYLTSYPDDIDHEWPANAPKQLVDKARKGHPTVKRNSLSKLESLGYRQIYMAGRAVNAKLGVEVEGTSKKRMHWRRGHWKRQAYGPQKSLRKLILIPPILVNRKDDVGEAPLGSIYISENVVSLKAAKKKKS